MGNITFVHLPSVVVQERLVARGVDVAMVSVTSTAAAVNAGKHVALLTDERPEEVAIAFAEALADSAAALDFCIGSLNLRGATGALTHASEIVNDAFVDDLWVILASPTPLAISRVVDFVRARLSAASTSRLLAVTSSQTLRDADLSPGARRTLVPIMV